MPIMRKIGCLAFGGLLLAACTPGANDPYIGAPPQGTVQRDLRREQARSALGDPNRAQQNPLATGASPGVGGIERAPGTGTGGESAGAPVSVSPGVGGIERAPGVGAPDSQPVQRRSTRRPRTSTTAPAASSGTTTTTPSTTPSRTTN